ncbi:MULTISPECIES: FAD-binding oxidoreductase [Bradyrhizobium]|uniref:FAD-binding oxidoreductase n=1 Tax=Bradyrhizobium TaxID=374 RepID=UPI00155E8ABA|nr:MULTISPECIES: FAD-binding oxidoreductase [Bradyrhizobium]MDD1519330.1 hydroxyacid dehydrogenase [Bradyrhizobium sp. WBAH30]MDD1543574.1 hydroxyacid dehydrogenase [Bradyrhizobium sp. WBAH41]MDD1557704.1 hydroxyacid dehydrogenase [Bradyrhizobium sp. WBAH23]MDD1565117.1 hydroxyacid dehydrogenase [Bradyrhizobium sp. WBAH33]MDD1590524.1 hydroxyacid dehydrogenase [Bradyrhizobium sp. WBAH42]
MALIEAFRQLLGDTAVLTREEDLAGLTEDWRGRFHAPALCAVLPSTTEQVAAIVRLCVAHGTPVLPQGGNTSLCGGATPSGQGKPPVIVALTRMRRIRSLDPVNNTMVVDAGCVLATIQESAAAAGRLYPVSLGAEGSCQIGGNIGTNAGGTGVLRYGNTRDNVLGLEVVLPDGSIWDGLYALRKNNTGYDLKHLFIGSEGTLGIITGAVLKLHPLPTAEAVAWLTVDSPHQALDVLGLFQAACNSRLSAFELMNAKQIQLVLEQVPGRRCPVAEIDTWHVLVELSDTGDAAALAATMQAVLEQALEAGLVSDGVVASSEAQRKAMWLVRHSVSEANKKAGVGLTSDTAVPVSTVPAFIDQAMAAVRAIVPDLPFIIVGHMGDGNIHLIPFFSFAEWDALPDRDVTAQKIRRAMNDVASSLRGTFSAEHGVGRTLTGEMSRYKPPVELALMRAVKQAFDPSGLFNPGRVLPPSSAPEVAPISPTTATS